MHLSRFSEELILWCSWEFKFIELDDAYSTGSSIMPQKKNPDVAELVRGKTGRVYGSLMGLLTVMKGLPLAYNKDMQEDKEPVFDAVDTVLQCLPVFTGMLATMKVLPENMHAAAMKGFLNATDCADYLTKKGMVAFCKGIQAAAPVDSYVTPEPWAMRASAFFSSLVLAPAFYGVCSGSAYLQSRQRKQIIRTPLLRRKGSDYVALVREAGLEPARP